MNSADWNNIKDKIYHWDGSWRDIYVLSTTEDDWSKWIDLINEKYSVEFYNGQTKQSEPAISKNIVFDYLSGKTDLLNSATLKLGSIIIKCYFFAIQEIQNDIDPREIATIEDHNRLIKYLVDISLALNKAVVLTAEDEQETVYISVNEGKVQLNTH